MKRFSVWITASRPKTLVASVAPVLIGTAFAVLDQSAHLFSFLAALIGALLIQIGTNFINDYYDTLKGADTSERKGPLRVMQAGLVTTAEMKKAITLVFAGAVLIGIYLVIRGGWPIVCIGLTSLLLAFLYTAGPVALAYLGIADFFVLTFFGPVASVGTYYVQALRFSYEALIAGFAPGFLSLAILTINNLRDREEDLKAQKKTVVVRFGKRFGQIEYTVCLLVAAVIPAWFYQNQLHRFLILLPSLAILFGSFPMAKTVWSSKHGTVLNQTLAQTGILFMIFSLLFTLGVMTS